MKKLFLALFAVLAISFTSTVSAVGGFSSRTLENGMFWGADVNRDGRLSIEEAEAIYNLSDPEVFAKYDLNGDGYITILEFYDYFLKRGPDE
ncbi:MAG: EF-hand domain-containing protein [Pseudomonadota bacterium]